MSLVDHSSHEGKPQRGFLTSPTGLVLVGFIVIAGALLLAEHRAHLWGVLVFLPILACPLMHFFMHGGHGGHGGHDQDGAGRKTS